VPCYVLNRICSFIPDTRLLPHPSDRNWLGCLGVAGFGKSIGSVFIQLSKHGDEIAARGNDYNLVVGRLSALHIVPKMILAHPVTGIGLGNYPLMRNDPMYLDGLPAVTEIEDLPALGIPGITAEMGVPITIWLVSLLLVPISGTEGKVPYSRWSHCSSRLHTLLEFSLTSFTRGLSPPACLEPPLPGASGRSEPPTQQETNDRLPGCTSRLAHRPAIMKPSSGTAATQHEWEDLAELDPLWAILTEKERSSVPGM